MFRDHKFSSVLKYLTNMQDSGFKSPTLGPVLDTQSQARDRKRDMITKSVQIKM